VKHAEEPRRDVTFDVYTRDGIEPTGDPIARWTNELPVEWDDKSCEFYMNDSSLCLDSIYDRAESLVVLDPDAWQQATGANTCLCAQLYLKVHDAPFVGSE